MKLNEIIYETAQPVEGYGPGFFRIGGQVIEGGVLVAPDRAVGWAGYDDVAPLLALADEVDFVLVGTGPEMTPLPADFRAALEGAGIGVVQMASPTACRSYNLAAAEGRRVALAALAV